MTITYCCYGAYADVGHSNDCPSRANPPRPVHTVQRLGSLLRPATRPPKPRLRPCMGIWTCETANVIAKGRTPAEAYREWHKETVIRGAAVMRSLRHFA